MTNHAHSPFLMLMRTSIMTMEWEILSKVCLATAASRRWEALSNADDKPRRCFFLTIQEIDKNKYYDRGFE